MCTRHVQCLQHKYALEDYTSEKKKELEDILSAEKRSAPSRIP